MRENIARVGDVRHNQGSYKGIRDGGNCKWESTMGETGEEQLMAALGREEQSGAGRKQGRRAGISQGTAGAGRVRRVCWEMPWKVYIPHCLFTWRKIPCRVHTGAGNWRQKRQDANAIHWIRAPSAHPGVQDRTHPCRCLSPRRLLSASSSFAKTNLRWVSKKSEERRQLHP